MSSRAHTNTLLLQDTKKLEYGALIHLILRDTESQSVCKSRHLRKRFQLKSTNEWAPTKIMSQHYLSAVCQGLCWTLEQLVMHRAVKRAEKDCKQAYNASSQLLLKQELPALILWDVT